MIIFNIAPTGNQKTEPLDQKTKQATLISEAEGTMGQKCGALISTPCVLALCCGGRGLDLGVSQGSFSDMVDDINPALPEFTIRNIP